MANQSTNQCRLCGVLEKLESSKAHTDSGQTYYLYHCRRCGGQFWEPFKNPGAAWYEHDSRYAGINADPYSQVNWHQKFVLTMIEKEKGIGKLFDVGCGSGNFLAFAKSRGWQVAGIDFDASAVRAARETFGVTDVEQVDLVNYANSHPEAKFDLITFFDVFEHIDNQTEFLTAIKKILKPKSFIAMSMPHRRGARWLMPYDLPPRHLTRWDEAALIGILTRHGFRSIYLKAIKASPNYIVLKLRFKYGRWLSFNLVNRVKKSVQVKSAKSQITTEHRLSGKVRLISTLAKIKDWLIFGLPALLIWLWLLVTNRLAVGLVAVAQKHD